VACQCYIVTMRKLRGKNAIFLCIALFIAMSLPPLSQSGEDLAMAEAGLNRSLVLGVHPYMSPSELIERFTPLAEHLGAKTGREVRVDISRDYAEHIRRIGEGTVDIAYMGPASYVEAVKRYGKFPLLAVQQIRGRSYFRGAIIKLKGSKAKKLGDLRGGSFAFGDPSSTMSHLVPKCMLMEAGLDEGDYSYEFLHSHDNVALGVLVGDFDAGAVKEEVYEIYRERGLEVLAYTPEIAEHLFIARKGLPEGSVAALRMAMYRLDDEPGGKLVLSSIIKGMTALVPVDDSEYEGLRKTIKKLSRPEVGR